MTTNIGGQISETILRLRPGPQIGLSQSLSQSQSQSQSQMRECPKFWGGACPPKFSTLPHLALALTLTLTETLTETIRSF